MLKNILSILLCSISLLSTAQEDEYVYGDNASSSKPVAEKGFDWQRVTVGGAFFAAFGSNTQLLIAPTFGYHLTDNFLVGVGVNYAYENVNTNVTFPYKSNTYGGSIFSQYKFVDLPLMAHAELELIHINVDFEPNLITDLTFNLVNPIVGGGLKQQLGDYSFFYALILFNLNENQHELYRPPNPEIRLGVSIGL